MKLNEIRNRVPFPLPAGKRLRARADFELHIPAAILGPPGVPISDLIVLSNQNADVGLKEVLGAPGKVSVIIVSMKAGDEICLGRSSEVMVDGLAPATIAFDASS